MKTITWQRSIQSALVLGVLALLVTTTVLARSSARAGTQDFMLVNQTGVVLTEVYVSPHTSNDWEEDVLGRDTLDVGASVKITFSDRDSRRNWDLKIVDEDGDTLEWTNLKLNEISKVTLYWRDGKGWADIE